MGRGNFGRRKGRSHENVATDCDDLSVAVRLPTGIAYESPAQSGSKRRRICFYRQREMFFVVQIGMLPFVTES